MPDHLQNVSLHLTMYNWERNSITLSRSGKMVSGNNILRRKHIKISEIVK